MNGNQQLIEFLVELERNLQAQDPEAVLYFPAIRSHFYFAARREQNNVGSDQMPQGKPGSGNVATRQPSWISMARVVFSSLGNVLGPLLRPRPVGRLVIAPAQHRHMPSPEGLVSKHLDSLLQVYAEDTDVVWEVGERAGVAPVSEPLPMHVARLARLMARLFPHPRPIRRLRRHLERAINQSFTDKRLNLDELLEVLAIFHYSHSYYRLFFSRTDIQQAYLVVYYSRRHLPIISALNELGIPTKEYQHGIQNNVHPLYTHWEHLEKISLALPSSMLLWNQVALNRINRWGESLGVQAEMIIEAVKDRPQLRLHGWPERRKSAAMRGGKSDEIQLGSAGINHIQMRGHDYLSKYATNTRRCI